MPIITDRLIYIAGKYSGENYHEISHNIMVAKKVAAMFAEAGVSYFCPHIHSEHFEVITPNVPYEFWLELDLKFLRAMAQGVFFLPKWAESKGAQREWKEADSLRLPKFYDPFDAIAWAKAGAIRETGGC